MDRVDRIGIRMQETYDDLVLYRDSINAHRSIS